MHGPAAEPATPAGKSVPPDLSHAGESRAGSSQPAGSELAIMIATVRPAARPQDYSDVKFNTKYFSVVYKTCSELLHGRPLAVFNTRSGAARAAAPPGQCCLRSESRVPGWVEASVPTK